MIEVQDLSLSIAGQQILHSINFTLLNGQNLIILGRSGSGKTILIKTLMGFFHPDKGKIVIDGDDIHSCRDSQKSKLRQEFAMVFQNAALLDSFSVFQNVALPLYERGLDNTQVFERVKKSLSIVGLEETMDKFPSDLSGGMRKRIGIARAIVYEPRYIIFDEPISGLDPITSIEVLYYITQIIKSAIATTITITHDIRNLDQIGDQVLFIEEGRSLFFGSLGDLVRSSNPIIRQFMQIDH